ncbi:MAG: SIR2 family protein [Chloroflexi bacterium]|nr:SIR2 family protein [Chloroflexota bacterium]
MIDPVQSLAFSMQSNPGVYALLLGSGLSTSAGIKTGWGIVLDLLSKLAAATDVDSDVRLEDWYRSKYDEEPEYSRLLKALAKTPTERWQLLRQYFEPTEQEREEGLKKPTEAHRAIAHLVSKGFIKVIITTNFDRLLETALEDAGVPTQVLSSLDQVRGALPLSHNQACVFKVHGDYRDTRIRNSPEELNSYPKEYNQFLNRVFDEFGLIVCGWSGKWDGALRNAIHRATSRRFTTYWAQYGRLTDEAQRLIKHRRAEKIYISGADDFFETIKHTIQSIEDLSSPHPLSPEIAVANMKRFLASPDYRIRLTDLIESTLRQAATSTAGEEFDIRNMPTPTAESVAKCLVAYESAYSTVLLMAPVAGRWAEDDHFHVWASALERLSTNRDRSGDIILIALKTYPAILLLYALGIGALASDRLTFLGRLFNIRVSDHGMDGQSVSILSALFAARKLPTALWGLSLKDDSWTRFTLNHWIYNLLREPMRQVAPSDEQYSMIFDRFEILLALAFPPRHEGRHYWSPLGMFHYRRGNRIRILDEIKNSLSSLERDSPFVSSGILDENPAKSLQDIEKLEGFAARWAESWGEFY